MANNSHLRVFVFIDGSNLFGSIRDLNVRTGQRIKVAYEKLFQYLAGDRELRRVYFYHSLPPEHISPEVYKQQIDFVYAVRQRTNEVAVNFKVRQAYQQSRGDYLIEKGTDVKLATDLLSLAYNDAYDVGVLVSGDADFIEVVEEVQRLGKVVENAVFRQNSSPALRDTCDRFIFLDEKVDNFLLV